MNITDAIKAKYPDPILSEPSNKNYSCFNTGGVEIEVGEFLYGLVRMIKPANILETGTHKGISAAYMASALRDNDDGHLTTIEFMPQNFTDSNTLLDNLGLSAWAEVSLMDAAAWSPAESEPYLDIVFLDTEPQTRFAELERIYTSVKPGGIIMIHDLHPTLGQNSNNPDHPDEPHWPYGPVPAKMQELIKINALRLVHFRTPRGLTLFYKPSVEDYTS